MTQRIDRSKDLPLSDFESAICVEYTFGQLAQSLRAATMQTKPEQRAKAEARANKFLAVIQNLASGALKVGQRQPYSDTPAWVTPEVVRGGFASGANAAGGAWLVHETVLAQRVGIVVTKDRSALNGFYLTSTGLAELAIALDSGHYRVGVPEESALLALRWLMLCGEYSAAADLLEAIEPFFDRLRFYPQPAANAIAEPIVGIDGPVLARDAHSVAEGLKLKTPSAHVAAMREHYEVWAPLTDKLVNLALETIIGDAPRFVDGTRSAIAGGLPFTRFTDDFNERRFALLAEITAARLRHRICRRVHRPSEVLGLLTSAMTILPNVDGDDRVRLAKRVRHRLAGFITAYGIPNSETHRILRTSQIAGPDHAKIAHVIADRIKRLASNGEGLSKEALATVLEPINKAEQGATVSAGTLIPEVFSIRLLAVQEAPLSRLLDLGLIRSAEVLANLLPQLTGPALATRFSDVRARALYAASYRAFRQRRSLLLLWLQHQVQFSELPWIKALEAHADADSKPAIEETLRQLAVLTIRSFPATITPNKLVAELSALAKRSSVVSSKATTQETLPKLPLVEELASDIFMSTFSLKFLRAAQEAARLFESQPGGSLYARYYGIDTQRILAMNQIEEQWNSKTCPDFDAYCAELAALPEGGNPIARNGAIIEQASILTTHNLAVLVRGLGLEPLLNEHWEALAERTFLTILNRLERRVIPASINRFQRMRASKTLAFSWRQMIFFLSFLTPVVQVAFVLKCKKNLSERTPPARQRFEPVLLGLEHSINGTVLPRDASHREVAGCRRLLGWSVQTPFLMEVASTNR